HLLDHRAGAGGGLVSPAAIPGRERSPMAALGRGRGIGRSSYAGDRAPGGAGGAVKGAGRPRAGPSVRPEGTSYHLDDADRGAEGHTRGTGAARRCAETGQRARYRGKIPDPVVVGGRTGAVLGDDPGFGGTLLRAVDDGGQGRSARRAEAGALEP